MGSQNTESFPLNRKFWYEQIQFDNKYLEYFTLG